MQVNVRLITAMIPFAFFVGGNPRPRCRSRNF